MKYFEFGREHPELMVMLHGGDLGHGTLAGEHPEQFAREVQAAHRQSLEKEKPDGTSSSILG